MLLSYGARMPALTTRRISRSIFGVVKTVAVHIDSPPAAPTHASFFAPSRIASSPASVQ